MKHSGSEKPLAVIAGAGVAGLAAALWLDRIGWRSIVVERAGDLRQGGYIMGLSGPGYEAARQLGILPQLEEVARDIDENVYRDRRGREILRLRYREFLGDLPYLVLRRTELIRILHEIVAPKTEASPATEIRLATTVEGFEDLGETVSVRLSDGETIKADLLIGADGARSAIRRTLFGEDSLFFQPLGYRFGVYDLADDHKMGLDFLSYVGPGHLTEYYTLSDDRLAALQVWRSEDVGPVPVENRWAVLSEAAASSHPNVRNTIEQAKGDTTPIVDDLTMVDLPAWSKGRVLLLGDSAHCLTLVSGQGAGMAMASAAILAEELAVRDIPEALQRHEQRLRPAINRLQDRSRRMAAWFIPASPVVFWLRNIMLRHMPRRMLARYFLNTVKSEIIATEVEKADAVAGQPQG